MSLTANLVELIKKAATDAVNASKPCAVMFGTIDSVTPLKIIVEQKMLLEEKQLILTHSTKSIAENEENKGKEVILLQMQGGQKFIVIDRMTEVI